MADKENVNLNSDSTTLPPSEGNADENKEVGELDDEIGKLQKEMDILLGEEPKEKPPEVIEPPKKGDLSKAVIEKNKKIHELKEKVRAYQEKLQNLNKPEEKKEEVKEEINPEEVNKRIGEINAKCEELEKKYKDSLVPFNKVEILLDVYKKTGGTVNNLDLLEDVYLSMLKKHETEGSSVLEARKEAQTETPSGQAGGVAYTPKNLDEAFEIIKKK